MCVSVRQSEARCRQVERAFLGVANIQAVRAAGAFVAIIVCVLFIIFLLRPCVRE